MSLLLLMAWALDYTRHTCAAWRHLGWSSSLIFLAARRENDRYSGGILLGAAACSLAVVKQQV